MSLKTYMKNNGRKLAIDKCYMTSTWQSEGMANIIITRRHAQGNVTAGVFMVDRYCLGVKDCFLMYNLTEEELLEKLGGQIQMLEETSYELVHNIIYGAWEYVEEIGLPVDSDLVGLVQYILEEDNDDIELIDIQFGKNGKPTFIPSPYDSEVLISNTLSKLTRTLGEDGFEYIDAR